MLSKFKLEWLHTLLLTKIKFTKNTLSIENNEEKTWYFI